MLIWLYYKCNLYAFSQSDRNKGTKLLLKIFGNLLNNLSELEKYGNLNFIKISKKLEKCNPAIHLLFIARFEKSNDGKRLIWKNNEESINDLKNVYNALKQKIDFKNVNEPHNKNISARKQKNDPLIIDTDSFKATSATVVIDGFTEEEAKMTLNLSTNQNIKMNMNIFKLNGTHCFILHGDTWNCNGCTYLNNPQSLNCEICGGLNHNNWECKSCTFQNHKKSIKCKVCGAEKTHQQVLFILIYQHLYHQSLINFHCQNQIEYHINNIMI